MRFGEDKRGIPVSGATLWALGLSLALHAAVMCLRPAPPPAAAAVRERRVRLVLSTPKAREKARQVVETSSAPSDVAEAEDGRRFLGEEDRTYRRQTVSERVGEFREGGRGGGGSGRQGEIGIGDLAMRPQALSGEGGPPGSGGEGRGVSQSNDFVEEVPLGDMTRLNTVEYKYYGFFNRIKRKLERHWGQGLRARMERLWRSGRRMPAGENRITGLVITLDRKGEIVDITIKGRSGVRELDEAAVESFNRAGPFPNPPRGMIRDGYAKIEWGFVVKS